MDGFVNVAEASEVLGVSVSTVWRMIRRGELRTVRRGGRRLVQARAPSAGRRAPAQRPFTEDHPIFRLVGAGRGGGAKPGAREKHELLDE